MGSEAGDHLPDPDGGRRNRIVLLNGTSSSGKTTLVRALQDRLPDPWLELGIDRFVFALPRRYLSQPGWSEVFRYVRPEGAADGPFTRSRAAVTRVAG